jgi:AraC family transcriptional regulator
MSHSQTLENGRFFGAVVSASRSHGLTLAETSYAPGFHVPSHEHTTPFVCVAIDGSFIEEYESDRYDLAAGAMFYHPGPGVHSERFGAHGGHCFVAQMDSDWVDSMRACGVELPDLFVRSSGDRAAALAAQARREFRRRDGASALSVEEALVALLAELTRTHNRHERRPPPWLRRATDLVHARYLGPVGLAALAEEVDVHPSHLARCFTRFHGCSVGELVRRLRLEHARELLAASERALSEIALSTGFADQSHFTRTFKRRFGVSPGEYRRVHGR